MTKEPRSFLLDVPVNGSEGTHKISVYEWTNETQAKATVFCVHGLTRNGRDFDSLASTLSEHYTVYAIDVAGRGKSEWHLDPVYYNYPGYVADIAFVVKKLGLKDIHWVGTSMGGIIGIMMANAFPGMLRSITLNDIGCLVPAAGLKRIAQYVGTMTNFPIRYEAEEELRRRCAPYGIKDEADWQHLFAHSIEGTGNGHVRLAYDPEIAKGFSPDIQDVNLWNFWEAVKTIPTLLIRGKESDLLTHETALEMQKSHSNFQLLEVAGIGHAPALIDAEQIEAIKSRLRP